MPAGAPAHTVGQMSARDDAAAPAPREPPVDHPFPDRRVAGLELAARLERLRHEAPLILALEPGGTPVAEVVAEELAAPFDTIAVARIGDPGQRVGAVAEGGPALVDHDLVRTLGISPAALADARDRAEAAVAERMARRDMSPPDVTGRTVVLVGDGLATGRAAAAAGRAVRRRGAARIVAAAPVATPAAMARLGDEVDEIICVRCEPLPGTLRAWYDQPLSSAAPDATLPRPGGAVIRDQDGVLTVPEAARALIVVIGPVGRTVAPFLADAGFATLVLPDAGTLAATTERVRGRSLTRGLSIGYFGAGRAATAVLAAGAGASAIVAAGGTLDPSQDPAEVTAPALLIAAGEEAAELRWTRAVCAQLDGGGEARAVAVAGATQGFPEPGAMEQVAHLATGWFAGHLG